MQKCPCRNVLVFLAIVICLSSFTIHAVAADGWEWPMFRFNLEHTGATPEAVTPPLTKLWNYTTGGGYSSPAVSGGVVYIGSADSNVYALNASTGAKIWNYTTGGMVRSSPAVSGGVVYIGSGDHNVYAFAPPLDHFEFGVIGSPQTASTAFTITITAKDASGNTVASYTGTNTLSDSTGTITPTTTGAFTAGSWTGNVAISKAQNNIVINTTGDGRTGTSNAFNVNPTSASVPTATGTGIATFSPDAGLIENLIAISESTFDDSGKPNIVFPHGFFSFTDSIIGLTPGATVTITITLPSAMPVGTQYWKYGPTPDNSTDHWYQLPIGDDDGDNIITITITDGGLGDDDLTANGVIADQGGPGCMHAYTIAVNPSSAKVAQGDSTNVTVTVNLIVGSNWVVTLSASGQPTGVSVSFDPKSGTPTFTSTMTITVGADVEPKTYIITITGTGSPTYTITFKLTVTERKPVGGFIAPSILELLTPWIGLIGAVGIVVAIVAIANKRHKHKKNAHFAQKHTFPED